MLRKLQQRSTFSCTDRTREEGNKGERGAPEDAGNVQNSRVFPNGTRQCVGPGGNIVDLLPRHGSRAQAASKITHCSPTDFSSYVPQNVVGIHGLKSIPQCIVNLIERFMIRK